MGPGLDQDVSWRTRQADNFTSKFFHFYHHGIKGGGVVLLNEGALNVK